MLRWVTLWRPVCIGFNLSFERLSVSWYERTWNAPQQHGPRVGSSHPNHLEVSHETGFMI